MRSDERKFPWISAVALLYPIAAIIYISLKTPANVPVIIGYGIANIGYLLIGAGIISGTFKIFGLKKRMHVFIFGIFALAVGAVLTNIEF